jgi:hypothetical protein
MTAAQPHLRNLQPGERFVLKRTGDRYTLLRRVHDTPAGTRYVVLRDGENREASLHHSCRVEPINHSEGRAPGDEP